MYVTSLNVTVFQRKVDLTTKIRKIEDQMLSVFGTFLLAGAHLFYA